MSGLSCKLPVSRDPDTGIALNQTFEELVKQNLINILMTIQGERMMLVDFGVGLKQYLFELDNHALRSELSSKIRSQVKKYLSYVDIISLEMEGNDENLLNVHLEYNILPLNSVASLDVSRGDNDLIVFS